MKKVNFNSKLQLKKEIVTNLNSEKMNEVKGGRDLTWNCSKYCIDESLQCTTKTVLKTVNAICQATHN